MTDPFAHGTPVGDYHMWVSPPSGDDCPDCECCTKRLCTTAIRKNSACHHEGRDASYDLADCPCWRRDSSARHRYAVEVALDGGGEVTA